MTADTIEAEYTEEEPVTALVKVEPQAQSALYELGTMTDEEFTRRVEVLQQGQARIATLQRSLLSEGTDWGTVPGVNKPFLFKPGAEKLCLFYHLVPEFRSTVQVETFHDGPPDRWSPDRITYTTRCFLHHQSQDGPIVGEGIGVATTHESRYRWRNTERICPRCKKPAVIKGSEQYGGGWLC